MFLIKTSHLKKYREVRKRKVQHNRFYYIGNLIFPLAFCSIDNVLFASKITPIDRKNKIKLTARQNK
jgi:hypothetical protein